MNDFESAEHAPTDVYEYEKGAKAPSRMQAALVATAGFVVFGGLVGGGAFAMTGGLPGILPGGPSTAAVDPTATDPAVTDPAATDPAATNPASVDPSATPTDALLGDPNATATASPTDVPADPTTTPGTQIVVPPVFGGQDGHGGGDDGVEGQNHQGGGNGFANGNHQGESHKHHQPNPTATADPTAAPTFSSGDDGGQDDGN